MSTQAAKAERFLALHRAGAPLLMPNPWDAGSAKLLTWLEFEALATTSGGFAQTVQLGIQAGLAGCSVEDYTGRDDEPFYELEHAKERVVAAAEAAHRGPVRLVLTARAENHLHGRDDIADTIARLQAYQEAGADVLFAAALTDREQLRQLISSVDLPVSVIARPGSLPVAELGSLGASRISVGPALLFHAYGALIEAARELRDKGTYGYHERAALGALGVREAFGPDGSDPSDTELQRLDGAPG